MASVELQVSSETVQEVEDGGSKKDSDSEKISNRRKNNNTKRRRKKKKSSLYLPKFGCFISESEHNGSLEMEADCLKPTHLVIMVNGLIGSALDWRYAAKKFLKNNPQDVIVYCSKSNSGMLTFEGVDVMGERLAEEVISVINRHPDVQKISFVGHSLGGLVARYAIARLYGRNPMREFSFGNGDCRSDGFADASLEDKLKGKIAGLEPMNFITFATPHLGSRGHKQVPLFCGFYAVEKAASSVSWFLGRSGRHLFLTDNANARSPLLLQMVNDCEDLPFMSALQSFKRRVAYANIRGDQLVGWSTSSLRRPNELPKRKHLSRNDKYRHIVNVETAKPTSPQQEVPLEAAANGCKTVDMEEEMIRALTKLSWERVDVSFNGIKDRIIAHGTIQTLHGKMTYKRCYSRKKVTFSYYSLFVLGSMVKGLT